MSASDTVHRDGAALMADAQRFARAIRPKVTTVLDDITAATDWLGGPDSGMPSSNAVRTVALSLFELAGALAAAEMLRSTWLHVATRDPDRTLPEPPR